MLFAILVYVIYLSYLCTLFSLLWTDVKGNSYLTDSHKSIYSKSDSYQTENGGPNYEIRYTSGYGLTQPELYLR